MRLKRHLALPFLLFGCGGGGSGDTSFIQGSVGTASIAFTAGTDYNGLITPLNTLTAFDGSAASKTVTVTATNNNRSVEVALISSRTLTGTVVDLSGTTGSSVLYTDPTGRWYSNAGTITVQARTTNSVTLLLTNVVLTAPPGATTVKGSVTLNGTLAFAGS